MARRVVLLTAAAVLVLAVSLPVFAQEGDKSVPACELSGGYGFMRDFELEENLPAGWYFSAAANLSRWFGVVGEVAGSHKTFDGHPFRGGRLTVLTGLGGPRVFRKVGHVVPYGQALVGAAHLRSSNGFTFGATDLAFQPGFGVLMYFNSRIGAQVSADYRLIYDDAEAHADEFRFLTGIVVGFGSR